MDKITQSQGAAIGHGRKEPSARVRVFAVTQVGGVFPKVTGHRHVVLGQAQESGPGETAAGVRGDLAGLFDSFWTPAS